MKWQSFLNGSNKYWLAGLILLMVVSPSSYAWYRLQIVPPRLREQAQVQIEKGHTVAAAKDLRKYIQLRPRDSEARLLFARCLLSMGLTASAEAVQCLMAIDDDDPLAVDARLRTAEILLVGLDRPADAERCLRRAMELDPTSFAAKQGLFHIYWWEGRKTTEVLQWLDDVWKTGNQRQRMTALTLSFWYRYAEAPPSQAAPVMQRFLRANPKDYGARLGWARCLDRQQRVEEAVVLWNECSKERPDDPIPRITLVEYALAQGNWTMARDILESWPESSREVNYWSLRGEYLQQAEGRYEEAIECFHRALAERPDRWSARYRMSQCLEKLGRPEQAEQERKRSDEIGHALLVTRVEQLLEEVVPNLESRPQGCYELAEFYEEVGLKTESERWRQMGQELESRATSEASSKAAPAQNG